MRALSGGFFLYRPHCHRQARVELFVESYGPMHTAALRSAIGEIDAVEQELLSHCSTQAGLEPTAEMRRTRCEPSLA